VPRGVEVNATCLQDLLRRSVRRGVRGDGLLRIEGTDGHLLWQGLVSGSTDGPRDPGRAVFEIASVTKTFTAALILLLAEEGALGLDQRIGELLPGETQRLLLVAGHDYGPEVTIRQALSHRSGLPDYWSELPGRRRNAFLVHFADDRGRQWRPRELLGYVRGRPAMGRPGERFHYCDTGYALLGLVIERVTEATLEEAFRRRLFAPLGLRQTYLKYYQSPPSGAGECHRYEGHHDLFRDRRQTAEWGGGGLVSSVADLIRFINAIARGELFRCAQTFRTMTKWRATGVAGVEYGLGLFRVGLPNRRGHLWGHDGHGNAFMFHWPEKCLSIAGSLNQTENDWWELVTPVLRSLAPGPGSRGRRKFAARKRGPRIALSGLGGRLSMASGAVISS
jgi:D-alanyl-D-alanine carboxypeptidase